MSQNIKITVLVDNRAKPELAKEHGFSMLIEVDDQKIIFDTGQNDVLTQNAESLNIDLSQINKLVLSHGHYDHTGGIPTVLHHAPKASVYLNSNAFLPRYSIREGIPKPINMPLKSKDKIISLPDNQVFWVSSPTNINDKIGITGPVPRKTDFEDTGGPFFLDPNAKTADPIEDDLGMWIKTDLGLVICVGCSHSGIINIINYIQEITGESRIHSLIGGFHLVNANQQRIDKTIDELKKFKIKHLIPCHCSGDVAMQLIAKNIDGVTLGHAGLIHQIKLG